jgi:hypothetical protein
LSYEQKCKSVIILNPDWFSCFQVHFCRIATFIDYL